MDSPGIDLILRYDGTKEDTTRTCEEDVPELTMLVQPRKIPGLEVDKQSCTWSSVSGQFS
jgi:hypothetical protein